MLKDKVVIITGSSIGIGREVARQLAGRGARLVVNARNEERLEKTRQLLAGLGAEVHAVPGDVSRHEDCERLIRETVARFGRLDVLINNAGLTTQFPLEQLKPEVSRSIIDANLNGVIYCTYYALPYLRESRGSVLFIGSLAGLYGLPNGGIYSATKMALTALHQSLRLETHGSGVHVGLAYVGFTRNDPEKTFLAPDGAKIPRPKRNPGLVEPAEKVAGRLIQMIEKRQTKRYFSRIGLPFALLNRIAPELVHWIIRQNLHRFTIEK